MQQELRTAKPAMPHSVIIQNRSRMTVSGVEDVLAFDEVQIDARTTGGMLFIKGSDLHIESLSIDSGELSVAGRIDELVYSDTENRREGFFSRLFR